MWVEKHITRQESPKGYYYPLLKAEKSTKLTRGIIQTSWSGLKLGMLKWVLVSHFSLSVHNPGDNFCSQRTWNSSYLSRFIITHRDICNPFYVIFLLLLYILYVMSLTETILILSCSRQQMLYKCFVVWSLTLFSSALQKTKSKIPKIQVTYLRLDLVHFCYWQN